MANQPINKNRCRNAPIRKKKKNIGKPHPKYGTSKLEDTFAHDFLDKLGVKYVYQFEAVDIGRFFDFYLPDENLIIEIDGDFWHGNPEKYKDDELRWHQKKARRVDEYKNKWALMHSIPILRIWESDIKNNPKGVFEFLKANISQRTKQLILLENKKKRH